MANVTIRNLNQKYDVGCHAVTDVNLESCDKEFVLLVGPSGCGESTTSMPPDAGKRSTGSRIAVLMMTIRRDTAVAVTHRGPQWPPCFRSRPAAG